MRSDRNISALSVVLICLAVLAGACSAGSIRLTDPGHRQILSVIRPIASRADLRGYGRAAEAGPDSVRSFMERFWAEHDPTPGTPENEYRMRLEARLEQGRRELVPPGLTLPDDRLKAWVLYGRPSRIRAMRYVWDELFGSVPVSTDPTDPRAEYMSWEYVPTDQIDVGTLKSEELKALEYGVYYELLADRSHKELSRIATAGPSPPRPLKKRDLQALEQILHSPETDERVIAAAVWRLRADPSIEAFRLLLPLAVHRHPLVVESVADALEPLEPTPESSLSDSDLAFRVTSWSRRPVLLDADGQIVPRVEEKTEVDIQKQLADPVLRANLLTRVHEPEATLSPNLVEEARRLASASDTSRQGYGWLTPEEADRLYTGPLATARELIEKGEFEEASGYLSPLLQGSLSGDAEAHHLAAMALLESDNPVGRRQAEEEVRTALRLDPGNLRYRLLLARVYDRQTFTYYADREVERILAETPAAADAYALRAVLRLQSYWGWGWKGSGFGAPLEDEEAHAGIVRLIALEQLDQALLLDPDNLMANWWLGLDALSAEDWTRAIPLMSRMVRYGVHTGEALLGRGWALQSLGQLDLAWQDYARAVEVITEEMRVIADDPRWTLPVSAGGHSLVATDMFGRARDGTRPVAHADPDSVREIHWRSKDPLLSTRLNQRLLEQYRRFAYVAWHFAIPSLGLRGWETQRGQVYLRYGEPLRATDPLAVRRKKSNSMLTIVSDASSELLELFELRIRSLTTEERDRWERERERLLLSEFWRSILAPERWEYPSLIFNFGPAMVSGNRSLQLSASDDPRVVDSVKEFEELTEYMPTSDYVVGGTSIFPLQAEWYAFRDRTGGTELVAVTRLPSLRLPERRSMQSPEVPPHPVYLLALDESWKELSRLQSQIPARRLSFASGTTWVAPPLNVGSSQGRPAVRHASLEIVSSISDTAFTHRQEIPDLSGRGLVMSSLVLATNVAAADEAQHWPEYSRIARPGHMVAPLPMRDFEASQPVSLYFEVYGLEKDEINATSYRVTYSTTSLREGEVMPVIEFLGRLIGRQEQEGTVRLVTQREGIQSDVQESVRIVFPQDLDSSQFRIVVKVEDLVGGRTVERSIEIRRR